MGQNIRIEIANGHGKTYVQIFLAISALKTRTTSPIIIVTLFRNLVQHFTKIFFLRLKQKNVGGYLSEQVIKWILPKHLWEQKLYLEITRSFKQALYLYIFVRIVLRRFLGCPRFRDAQMLIFDDLIFNMRFCISD